MEPGKFNIVLENLVIFIPRWYLEYHILQRRLGLHMVESRGSKRGDEFSL